MAAITQKPLPCDEKQRLYKDMVLAIVELKRLHESEIDALLSGRVQRKDLSRFDVAIQRASAQREAAKQAYLRHVFEHKC